MVFSCRIKFKGLSDSTLSEGVKSVFNIFDEELINQIEFQGKGVLYIEGEGEDNRCAFCNYFTKWFKGRLQDKKMKGSFAYSRCPFNKSRYLNFTKL